jgi:hypothetical protein
MLAAYRVDVLDPAVTPRRIWVLLQRLPPWAVRPGAEWSTEADLLALLIDHVANLTWITLQAAGARNPRRPRPLPRPKPRTPVPAAAPAPHLRAEKGKSGWFEMADQLSAMGNVITKRADG